MILSGNRIREEVAAGNIGFDPFDDAQVNPNSYNVRLHKDLVVYNKDMLDMAEDHKTHVVTIPEEGLVLQPGVIYLGRTIEYTESPKYVPMLEGRSSIGRLGMTTHVTAGVGDKLFSGHWTFELSVVQPLRVYAGVEIAQVCFYEVDQEGPTYAGKYINKRNTLPGPSGLWKELSAEQIKSLYRLNG